MERIEITLRRCSNCRWWTYVLGAKEHEWNPPPLPDDIAEDVSEVVEVICSICEQSPLERFPRRGGR
jgi:hypothetical protein